MRCFAGEGRGIEDLRDLKALHSMLARFKARHQVVGDSAGKFVFHIGVSLGIYASEVTT